MEQSQTFDEQQHRLHPNSSDSSNLDNEMSTIENLSPGMTLPVVVFDESQNCFMIEFMVWGLVPNYQSPKEYGDHYKLFNKRIESFFSGGKTANSSSSAVQNTPGHTYFNRLVEQKRCLVVIDGFYEWKGTPGKKQPYYIYLDSSSTPFEESSSQEKGEPILIPAIYEDSHFMDRTTNQSVIVKTFTMLTCDPSPFFKEIHNRQPVFLTTKQAREWLCSTEYTEIYKLLRSMEANIEPIVKQDKENAEADREGFELNRMIRFYPVDRKMTDAKYQGNDCATPLSDTVNKINKISSYFTSRGKATLASPLSSPTQRVKNEDSIESNSHLDGGNDRSLKTLSSNAEKWSTRSNASSSSSNSIPNISSPLISSEKGSEMNKRNMEATGKQALGMKGELLQKNNLSNYFSSNLNTNKTDVIHEAHFETSAVVDLTLDNETSKHVPVTVISSTNLRSMNKRHLENDTPRNTLESSKKVKIG